MNETFQELFLGPCSAQLQPVVVDDNDRGRYILRLVDIKGEGQVSIFIPASAVRDRFGNPVSGGAFQFTRGNLFHSFFVLLILKTKQHNRHILHFQM